ncbi:PrpF domain-containing protein [Sporosarcina sp. FA9]|uniref:PrpF domain-containing protein n=1 Tax=Sporosarcina sp. FA9 TaxID=3413030 RepID=UPI003F65D123
MSQFSVPCVVYRGGTSRGLFFDVKDLPEDRQEMEQIFINGIDSYNLSQVNGLGSGTSHTSKVVVISPPSVEGADINYTFYQIGIGEEVVDDKGTCGNLMAAVGAYAVDEQKVAAGGNTDVLVNAFNTNIDKMIRIRVPIINGKARVTGDYQMSGLTLSGAKYSVDILSPGGGKTGSTFPLGTSTDIVVNEKNHHVSVVDIVNPFVYISRESVKGFSDEELLAFLESTRCEISVQTGLTNSIQEATDAPAIPKIAIVSPPHNYVTSSGKEIKIEEVDIVAKMVSMGRFHRTFAGSGLYNLAAATLLPGTVPNDCSGMTDSGNMWVVRIGHPDGIAEVQVQLNSESTDVESVGLERTARRIMKGNLYIPEKNEEE